MNIGLFLDDLNNELITSNNEVNIFIIQKKDNIDLIEYKDNYVYIPCVLISNLFSIKMFNDEHKSLIDELSELKLDVIHICGDGPLSLLGVLFASTYDIPLIRDIKSINSLEKIYSNNCMKYLVFDNNTYDELIRFGYDENDLFEYDKEKLIDFYYKAFNTYKYSLNINKLKIKDDSVTLYVSNFDGEDDKLIITIDDYINGIFKQNSKITKLNYYYLKDKESELLAYKAALRKLSTRDYSRKEISDVLKRNYRLNNEKLEKILNKLDKYNLIDDYRFALGKVESLKSSLCSNKAIKTKLKKLGISDEIFNKCLKEDENDELEFAKAKAEKYFKSIKNKSVNAKKQSIYSKLIADGFSYETSKSALNNLNFLDTINEEKHILIKEANKAFKKYEKKFTDKELKNKVYQYLASKGFNFDDIQEIINEMEFKHE